MQLGLLHPPLKLEERQRRRQHNLCLYCGEPGHYMRSCPAKLHKCLSVSSVSTTTLPSNFGVPILLQPPGRTIQVNAIINSGACSCFINLSLASEHHIPLQAKAQRLSVQLPNGSAIKFGLVTQETVPLPTTIAKNHQELLCLNANPSPLFPVILGMPWLKAHNPHINWATKEIMFHSPFCLQHCLQEAPAVPGL